MPAAVQLVTRAGCHLCEDAAAGLRAVGVQFETLDVDADPELQRLYDFRVPVVLVGGRVVGEGRIDASLLSPAARLAITVAGPEVAREVERVTKLAFAGYTWLTPPSGAIAETEDDVRRDLQTGGGALARLDGAAVAALRWSREPTRLHVRRVAVDPGLQGLGVGRALMEWTHAYAAAQGFREVGLGVRAQLPGNLRFYEGLGYHVVRAHARSGSAEIHWYELRRPVP